jgi:phosphatidylinositol kinase/protein kinase (PI-3  family)
MCVPNPVFRHSLTSFFFQTYGDPSSAKFARAQRNFAKSLAGYSIITYLLQIKDRHNGNILLDRDGHLIHIDFGFILSNSPGNIGFEAAPFKLPLEYVEVLGGPDSEPLREFRRLFHEGFEAARKHCDRIVTMVELMQKGTPRSEPRGYDANQTTIERFHPPLFRGVWRPDCGAVAGALSTSAHAFACGGTCGQAHRHVPRFDVDAPI